MKDAGFYLVPAPLRGMCMTELRSRGQDGSLSCKDVAGWKLASLDGSEDDDIKSGKDALMEALKDWINIKRAGLDFE